MISLVNASSMAWRLEKFVEHGVIDNSVPGITTGRIWICGMEDPLLLELEGDCWRDLAGAKLEFTNPTPQSGGHFDSLDPDQVGLVGDMTAAMRVNEGGRGEGSPPRWNNTLYLEWFSEANGRVLIESTHYKLRVSDHSWRMDEDEEQAQKLANLQAMRDFMARMIGRNDAAAKAASDEDPVAATEEIMRQSQRVSRAFGEVLEKYGDDPESERKEAFVMGWDRKLEALADREEAMNLRMPPPGFDDSGHDDDDPPEAWQTSFDDDGGEIPDDGLGEFYCDEEPVVEKARELCLRAMELVDHEADPETPAARLTSALLEVSSKLAAAFENDDEDSDDLEAMSFILAILKQCLGLINDALSALQELASAEASAPRIEDMEELKSGIFSIRDDVVELCRDIREEM